MTTNDTIDVDFKFNNKQADVDPVGMDSNEIVNALHLNASFFINFYMAEELTHSVPQFHIDSWNLITAEMIAYIALALPRGHAKTTLAKLCAVWYLLFTPIRFIVYVSNTLTPAAESCKTIVDFITSENHLAVFGPCRWEVRQEGHGFYKFWMTVPDGHGGFKEKYVIIKALGAGQQVRGLNVNNERPQLAIVDDLEDNENTATPELQKKMRLWFFGTFIKALSRKNHKVIYIGNLLNNQSLIYYMCEKSEVWFSRRFGCLLSNGEPLWPDLWSFEAIREDFKEYQRAGLTALWFAEMMNMPMAEGQALIHPDDITYQPIVLPGEHKIAFITVDPAFSAKEWANDSAVVVHAYIAERWQIAEIVSGKFSLEQLYAILSELCLRWRTRVVGIEKGPLEAGLKVIFELMGKLSQQKFEIYEVPHKNRSKTERLAAWCAALCKQVWTLTEGDITVTQQLVAYDPLKKQNVDDIIDACAMGIMMTEMYMSEIMRGYLEFVTPVRVTKVLPN